MGDWWFLYKPTDEDHLANVGIFTREVLRLLVRHGTESSSYLTAYRLLPHENAIF